MVDKKLVRTGTPWEPKVGYCRAVRMGNQIAVSGCAPVDSDGDLVGEADAYVQAKRCIEVIDSALQEAGAGLPDVIRTRMFVTDISLWEDFGRAHREAFGEHPPATSLVEVSRLIGEGMLIEIEADAVVCESR